MKLSHENRLLLACIQSEYAGDLLNKINDIPMRNLNWEDFLASSLWHGIAPLAYFNMTCVQQSFTVPENVMSQLRSAYYQNIARSTWLYAELNRVLSAFQKESVEVIVLKGSALAKTVYYDNRILQSIINEISSEQFNSDIIGLIHEKMFLGENTDQGTKSISIRLFGKNTIKNRILKNIRSRFPIPEVISRRFIVFISSKKRYLHFFIRLFSIFFRPKSIVSQIARIKEDAVLYRWIYNKDSVSDVNK
jgi:hypothetical protein